MKNTEEGIRRLWELELPDGEGGAGGGEEDSTPHTIEAKNGENNFTGGSAMCFTLDYVATGSLSCKVDGVSVSASDYDVTEEDGKTVITLKTDFLKTLSLGYHSLEVQDGDDDPIYTTFKTCGYDTVTGERLFWDEIKEANALVTDTTVGVNAFKENTDITCVSIPDSVTSIERSAFYKCTNLTDVIMSERLTSVGDFAFYNCSALYEVKIPDGVTRIGENAFDSCSNLTLIEIPDSVTGIEFKAFRCCTNLISVEIPDSATYIEEYAFYNCTSLSSIEIPANVKTINENAFYTCTNLSSVEISSGVTLIEENAFKECYNLVSITVSEENTAYKSINGAVYTKSGDKLIVCPGATTSFEVAEGVTQISTRAFGTCINLTELTFSNSVTKIDTNAFYDCGNLSTINFNGTRAEWASISKYSNWDSHISKSLIVHCTDGNLNYTQAKA